ncbi:16S rRNA (guanine(966)-N(2))-methyltransferase RsmD [Acidocella sp.]|uniref:16S rRNA (guanine(966)-N(2))-methyltransferase RsmD n=1 Tax=Acidocella sp. TaxID=50710 RepID=UPI0026156F26|nr:16S rRNA (guanine(966)-N(2))-methyltransferase RsmD [Acidocella sp.]
MTIAQGPRIVAGLWRGRRLQAPDGQETRPTNVRARQAVFDILAHTPWCELRGAKLLDVFAGTGAYGLEALSRGAGQAVFFEQSGAALRALRANIAACGAEARARVQPGDVRSCPPGTPHDLVFLDPPYGQNLVPQALSALAARGWLAEGAVIVAEFGPGDDMATPALLAARSHGKAQVKIWRFTASGP